MTAPAHRSSFALTLLTWRTRFGFGALESALLALYTAILAFTIPYHEPWADEAQAWLIARDNSLWQILRYRLHYEGHPGLWHVLLHLFQQLGGRYSAIDYFGAAFAVAGIAIFLRYSPFPLLLRILLPFTFFFQYQYGVIGRSYTLFSPLAFGLCALFYSRRKPVWFLLLAGVLANVSLQGAVHSFLMVGLYLYQHLGKETTLRERSRPYLAPTCLYLALFAIAVLTAVPAPDTGIAGGPPVVDGTLNRLLSVYPGPLPKSQYLPALEMPHHIAPAPGPYPPAQPPPPAPSALLHPAAWAGWYVTWDQSASGPARNALKTSIELLTLATAPLATIKLLALAFLGTLTLWLRSAGKLRMLLPWLANLVVGEVLWIADHHTGLLLIALLTAIWLAAPSPEAQDRAREDTQPHLSDALILLLAVLAVLQIAWTGSAIRKDVYQPYDPGPATAAWLLQHPHRRMATFGFVATGVQPFFATNPFINTSHSYYIWAVGFAPEIYHFAVLEERPDLVLLSQDLLGPGFTHNDWAPLSQDGVAAQNHDLEWNPVVQDLHLHGYTETHRFCGDRFFRFSASYRGCNLIFEPTGPDQQDPAPPAEP